MDEFGGPEGGPRLKKIKEALFSESEEFADLEFLLGKIIGDFQAGNSCLGRILPGSLFFKQIRLTRDNQPDRNNETRSTRSRQGNQKNQKKIIPKESNSVRTFQRTSKEIKLPKNIQKNPLPQVIPKKQYPEKEPKNDSLTVPKNSTKKITEQSPLAINDGLNPA